MEIALRNQKEFIGNLVDFTGRVMGILLNLKIPGIR